MRAAAAALVVVLIVAAGLGWLYVLRRVGWLDAGPRVHGALALQQLAGNADQPLLRVAVAWLPAGLVAGWAVRRVARTSVPATALLVGAVGWVELVAIGAVSDAIAANDRVGLHVGAQLGRGGVWWVGALLVIGSALAAGWAPPAAAPERRWGSSAR